MRATMAGMEEPHVHTLALACDPGHAFEVFTSGMGGWWDPTYSPDPERFSGIEVEQHVGGSVSILAGDDHYPFGAVTAWEPGLRYAQTFWLAMESMHPSTLTATFALGNGGCEMRFEHGGWDHRNADVRDKYRDWPALLARFQTAAEA
jgi:hypothetical protein